MKRYSRFVELGVLVAVVAIGVRHFCSPPPDPLQGTWQTDGGELRITFHSDGTYDCWRDYGKQPGHGTYWLDSSKNPSELLAVEAAAGTPVEYHLSCERLTDRTLSIRDKDAAFSIVLELQRQ